MATGNLERCLDEVFPFEGGYVDHPRDPGGATNMGITFKVLKAWRGKPISKQDVKTLSKADAAEIYAKRYWRPLRGDDLRRGDDLVVLDFGINSGIDRSARYAQAIAGVAQDGQIGPVTLTAIGNIPSRDFIKKLCAKRLGFVQGLKIWETFGKGWARRIAHMEAAALSWVSNKSQLEADAKDAKGAATGQGAGAAVTVGTGAADQVNGLTGLPWWAVAAVILLIAAPLIIRTIINAQRSQALAHAAQEK